MMLKKIFLLSILIVLSMPNLSFTQDGDECNDCMYTTGLMAFISCYLVCFGLAEHNKSSQVIHNPRCNGPMGPEYCRASPKSAIIGDNSPMGNEDRPENSKLPAMGNDKKSN